MVQVVKYPGSLFGSTEKNVPLASQGLQLISKKSYVSHDVSGMDAFQNYFSADLFADLFQNLMIHQQIVIKEVNLDCNI